MSISPKQNFHELYKFVSEHEESKVSHNRMKMPKANVQASKSFSVRLCIVGCSKGETAAIEVKEKNRDSACTRAKGNHGPQDFPPSAELDEPYLLTFLPR